MVEGLSLTARADFDHCYALLPTCRTLVIFTEGEPATGIYVVLEGEVRVSIGSADGKHLILRIARKADVLGLSSVLAGDAYNVTTETLYPAKLAYVGRETLPAFLSRHPSAYQQWSRNLAGR